MRSDDTPPERTIGLPSETRAHHASRRGVAWTLLLVLVAAAAAAVLAPVFLIQPFTRQSAASLQWAYSLRAWSSLLTIGALLTAIVATALLWRPSRRWWQRSALVLCVALAAGFSWLARQNHFEWMFAPMARVEYAAADDVSFVENDDQVLAVEIHGVAAAYPVRQLAYHHLVQDTVGGTPIVVTY